MSLASTSLSAAAARPGDAAPSPAVAPPPGNPRFPLFDSIRGIAVLIVVLYHVGAVTGELNKAVIGDLISVAGSMAISLLFMTSGFLLYRPFVRARAAGRPLPSVRKYLRRRMLRILPAYWVSLTLLAIFPGLVGVFSGDWWRYYFFLQLYSNRTLNTGNPVAWTLCVEMTFYLILPVWAIVVRRVRIGSGRGSWLASELVPLAIMFLFGAAIQVAAARLAVSRIVADSVLGSCTWISLGMGLAVISTAVVQDGRSWLPLRLVTRRPGLIWAGAAACLIGATAILQPGGLLGILLSLERKQAYASAISVILLTAGACVLLVAPAIFGDHAGGFPRRVLAWRPLPWIGLVAYSYYLWHLSVVSVLSESRDPAHFSATGLGLAAKIHHAPTPILFVLSMAGTSAVAALSYRFVELPFLRRKERSVRPQPGGEPGDVVVREQDQPVV
jgi:peptidoglycan/LPS O-acetylase OafA/YrhL